MRIDGDGILTVRSFVRKLENETLIEEAFSFVSGQDTQKYSSETLENLGFRTFYLENVAQLTFLKKHLLPSQAEQALQLVAEANPILETEDEARAQPLLERMQELVKDFPVPTWDVFWARWAAEDPKTSAIDRSKAEQTLTQMERAASREDYDTANQYLEQLRQKTSEIIDRLPTSLLKQRYG